MPSKDLILTAIH